MMLSENVAWNDVRKKLKVRLGAPVFESWIADIKLGEINGACVFLYVQNIFVKKWIENHYAHIVHQCFKDTLPIVEEIVFSCDYDGKNVSISHMTNVSKNSYAITAATTEKVSNINLAHIVSNIPTDLTITNQRQSLGNFLVSDVNKFAVNMSKKMIEDSKLTMPQLLITGSIGNGKTHLARALVEHAEKHNQSAIYLSFQEMHQISQHYNISEANNRVLQADIIVIDDVHLIQSRYHVQRWLCNFLDRVTHLNKKVIFFTSVKPKYMIGIFDSMLNRLLTGLLAEIHTPDKELKEKFLMHYEKNLCYILNDEQILLFHKILDFNNVAQWDNILDVRTLISICHKICAAFIHSSADGTISDSMNVRYLLYDLLPASTLPNKNISLEKIKYLVARHYELSIGTICSRQKTKMVIIARQIMIFLSKKYTNCSLTDLAQFFQRTKSTISHDIRQVQSSDSLLAAAREIETLLLNV